MPIKYANNGDLLPRFYGVAWYDWQGQQAVCLPLGLNVLAAIGRSIYFSVKHAGRIVHENPRDAYAQGLRDGRASVTAAGGGVRPTRPWPRA